MCQPTTTRPLVLACCCLLCIAIGSLPKPTSFAISFFHLWPILLVILFSRSHHENRNKAETTPFSSIAFLSLTTITLTLKVLKLPKNWRACSWYTSVQQQLWQQLAIGECSLNAAVFLISCELYKCWCRDRHKQWRMITTGNTQKSSWKSCWLESRYSSSM